MAKPTHDLKPEARVYLLKLVDIQMVMEIGVPECIHITEG